MSYSGYIENDTSLILEIFKEIENNKICHICKEKMIDEFEILRCLKNKHTFIAFRLNPRSAFKIYFKYDKILYTLNIDSLNVVIDDNKYEFSIINSIILPSYNNKIDLSMYDTKISNKFPYVSKDIIKYFENIIFE